MTQAKTLASVEDICVKAAENAVSITQPSFITQTEDGVCVLHANEEIYDGESVWQLLTLPLKASDGKTYEVKMWGAPVADKGLPAFWFRIFSMSGKTVADNGDTDNVRYLFSQEGNSPKLVKGQNNGSFVDQCVIEGDSTLVFTIPENISGSEGATLTFDFSEVQVKSLGNVLDAGDPAERRIANGGTYTWDYPVFLEEVGDVLQHEIVFNFDGQKVFVDLTISKMDERYKGEVKISGNVGSYRAGLRLDTDGRVTGYDVIECPSGHEEGEKTTHSKANLLIPAISYSVVYGTFDLDLSQLQIIDGRNITVNQGTGQTLVGGGATVVRNASLDLPTAFSVSDDGVLMGTFEDGSMRPLYQLALATCPAPDKMAEKSGGVYVPTSDSGDLMVGTSGENGFGTVVSGALENSTTDIAQTLAVMIELQSAYAANTQVISAISKMLDMLMRV
jgi:flagellar hook protein FlgE